jgi:glycosyltransferase involved in cell wall biosynthesis
LKVIIQIPCFNEEASLGITLQALPRSLPGVDELEWLVIDDGSEDRTVEVAERFGVHHIVRFSKHQGLAAAFSTGLRTCIDRGADIIVNTDADNQYCAGDITKLLDPILSGASEFVLGARPLMKIKDFSLSKRFLHIMGSAVMSFVTRQRIEDPTTGFRAIHRRVASRMRVYNKYTYTLETLIQMAYENIPIHSVPIRTNRFLRPSRLIENIPSYLLQSARTIILTCFRYYGRPRPSLEVAESMG